MAEILINDLARHDQWTASAAQTTFDYNFPIFEEAALVVVRTRAGVDTPFVITTDYTVTGVGVATGGTIELVVGATVNDIITIYDGAAIQRLTDFVQSGDFLTTDLNREFDRIVTYIQQLETIINSRAVLLKDSTTETDNIQIIEDPVENGTIKYDANGDFVNGPTTTQIENAEADAAAAAASAAAAAASETNAGTSETNAAASAAAAAASVASVGWNDVVYVTDADSPIAITDANKGKMYSCDCTSGAIVFNFAGISTLDLAGPWVLGVLKTDGSGNSITVNPDGTDTINLGSVFNITSQASGGVFIPDTDKTPDDWTAYQFGPGGVNIVIDNFADTTDYTSGTTTFLDLSINPGTENNIEVTFDGVTQHHDTFSLSGVRVTFDAAIPTGTDNVQVRIIQPLGIGVPADASITPAKLTSGMVVNVEYVEDGEVNTGSGVILLDDSIPISTEGDEYIIKIITPSNSNNILEIESLLHLSPSVNAFLVATLFKDSDANALAVATEFSLAGGIHGVTLRHQMVAGTTSPITFKMLAGQSAAGTLTFNGSSSSRMFGGILMSSLKITEIVV